MNQLKTRLQALSLLDRALTAMSDEELATLVASLPDDHRTALDKLCGARDEEGFTDPAARTLAIRSTAARGRMNGGLEQITTDEGFDGFPMFSPDGKKLIWASQRADSKSMDVNLFIADFKP